MESFDRKSIAVTSARVLLVSVVYYATARLCIELPVREGDLSPIWIPSGIALVAVLNWGSWMAIGAFLGEFAAVLVGGLDVGVAFGLGLGNLVEPLVMVALLRAMDFDRRFARVGDVLAFSVAIVIGAAVSATIGVGTLVAYDAVQPDASSKPWWLFWSSVVLGAILIAPVLLSWRHVQRPKLSTPRSIEALVIPTLVVLVSLTVFERQYLDFISLFLLFPLFVWATLRFGAWGASGSVLIVAAIGVWATVHGATTVEGLTATDTASLLQGILVVIALTNLFLTALVTERDHARMRARQLADTLEEAQSIAHVGSWEWMFDEDEVQWSPELGRIFGLEAHAGKPQFQALLDSVHEDDRAAVEERINTAIDEQSHFEIEHRVRQAPGRAERSVLHVGAVQGAGPGGSELVGVVLDLTDQKAVERSKNALISTASHELRTPLTSIIGFADTLTSRWGALEDEERLRFVMIIRTQGERMTGLIHDTLVQSDVDSGSLPVTRDRFHVLEAINATLDSLDRELSASVEVDCDPELVACGSLRHLEQIAENLIVNADKYGKPPIQIVCSRSEGGMIEMRVVDHGAGVSAEFEPRMFERFTRASSTEEKPGSGLGLSIVRGLAEANEGAVRYERVAGATVFIVTIPEWRD